MTLRLAQSDPSPILAAMRRLGGRAAIWQVAIEMRLPDHCISQRFSELVDRGHLILTGDTNRRPISDKVCKIYAIPAATQRRCDAAEPQEFRP